MRFEKWQALGNDYVIVERDELPWELTAERVREIRTLRASGETVPAIIKQTGLSKASIYRALG